MLFALFVRGKAKEAIGTQGEEGAADPARTGREKKKGKEKC